MVNNILDERLNSIKKNISDYCDESLKLYSQSISLVSKKDNNIIKKIIKKCKSLDIKAFNIERECIKFIAIEQPVANDLMYVEAVIRILSHVKRINHLSKNIAKKSDNISCCNNLMLMSSKVENLLKKGFTSFNSQDLKIARNLDDYDDKIDGLFDSILKKTTKLLSLKNNDTSSLINTLIVARYLERIGDRVVSIGDRIIYINTDVRPSIEELKDNGLV